MALTPQTQSSPEIGATFLADRALFWHRFTGFTKFSVVGIVLLLVVVWVLFG